jgi:HlyD family secretion protein
VVTGTMNNAGTMILEVADLTKMLMVAHVDESQIDSIKVGQHAIVRIGAYHDQVFDGKVNTVGESRTTDTLDQTKYFEIKILLDLKGRRIRSGLSADVDIETQRQKNVLKVPSQSVMGRPVDQLPDDLKNSPELEKGKTLATVVFRLIDNKAVMTPVRVGASDDTHTIIKSGLKENEPVIVGPYKALEGLTNGQVVKLEGTKSTANRP